MALSEAGACSLRDRRPLTTGGSPHRTASGDRSAWADPWSWSTSWACPLGCLLGCVSVACLTSTQNPDADLAALLLAAISTHIAAGNRETDGLPATPGITAAFCVMGPPPTHRRNHSWHVGRSDPRHLRQAAALGDASRSEGDVQPSADVIARSSDAPHSLLYTESEARCSCARRAGNWARHTSQVGAENLSEHFETSSAGWLTASSNGLDQHRREAS